MPYPNPNPNVPYPSPRRSCSLQPPILIKSNLPYPTLIYPFLPYPILPYPTLSSIVLAVYGASWPLQLELVVPLIDLLHRVLHYVILCLASHHQDHQQQHDHNNNHNNHYDNRNDTNPGENLRLLVSPLRHVCPALLVVLAGAGATTPQPPR